MHVKLNILCITGEIYFCQVQIYRNKRQMEVSCFSIIMITHHIKKSYMSTSLYSVNWPVKQNEKYKKEIVFPSHYPYNVDKSCRSPLPSQPNQAKTFGTDQFNCSTFTFTGKFYSCELLLFWPIKYVSYNFQVSFVLEKFLGK